MTLLEFLILAVAVATPTVLLFQSRKFVRDLERDWNSLWRRYHRVATERDKLEQQLSETRYIIGQLKSEIEKAHSKARVWQEAAEEFEKQNDILLSEAYNAIGGFVESSPSADC